MPEIRLFEPFAAVLSGFYALIPSYGLAIILLTVVVRLVILPLTLKQTRSMREMQTIQPEIKKLQAKYKGDRQKLNEEMMKLYKEHGVNPFGSCLPMLVQMPLLIALFYVIRAPLKYLWYSVPPGAPKAAIVPPSEYVPQSVSGFAEILQQSRLAEDLTQHALRVNQFLGLRLDCTSSAALNGDDPSKLGEVCGSGVLSALPYLLLVAVVGFTTYYQQRQMQMRNTGDNPQAQQMQILGKVMPVMLMFFSYTFPAGVVIYWITTNLWTIGQQRLMLGSSAAGVVAPGASPSAAKASANPASKPTTGKPPKAGSGKPGSHDGRTTGGGRPHPSKKKKKR